MRSTAFAWTIAAIFLLPVTPIFAQGAPTTYLSSTGDDDNACSTPATACAGFGRANNQTMVGGTIVVLDSDSYGSGSITKSLNIIAQGAAAVVQFSASGGPNFAALSINTAASDVVTIRGLTFGGNSNSFAGINFLGAGALHVEDCAIHDNRSGIDFTPSGVGELYVTNCTISDNGTSTAGAGIFIRPTGSGIARVVIDDVQVENNRGGGIVVDRSGTTGVVNALVTGSMIAGNSRGVISRAGATVRLRDTTISGNGNGLFAAGGAIISHGGNVVADNPANGAFTATVPQQ